MGFTSAFLSSATLTTGVLYLTLTIHQRNRAQQSLLLRQQAQILNGIIDPQAPPPPPSARVEQAGWLESAKDRWNEELAEAVWRLQHVDWTKVRNDTEDKVATAWGKMMQTSREEAKQLEESSKS
ncbi:MAG: hypothetical protein M1819_001978 [Sarea resinae]|nr:MAG: hypothetical protein M1819_001978 [Sarea resinae]